MCSFYYSKILISLLLNDIYKLNMLEYSTMKHTPLQSNTNRFVITLFKILNLRLILSQCLQIDSVWFSCLRKLMLNLNENQKKNQNHYVF